MEMDCEFNFFDKIYIDRYGKQRCVTYGEMQYMDLIQQVGFLKKENEKLLYENLELSRTIEIILGRMPVK